MLSTKEALAMQGTEFEYEFGDGDTIRCYVKKFDPNKGLSCWSLGLATKRGFVFEPETKDEEAEEAVCIIGIDFVEYYERLNLAYEILNEIKHTGRRIRVARPGVFAGCPL